MITDELLFRFLNQETSHRENRMIRDWLSQNPDQLNRLNSLKEISESAGQNVADEEILNHWNLIEPELQSARPEVRLRPALTVRLTRIAAILLILIGTGLIWFYQPNTSIHRNRDMYAKTIILPDGTQVDLGPESKLVYDKGFSKGIRVIRLTGEAYFDVSSDPDHPFIVIAGSAKIKVTGTQFVVHASNRNEEVEVSVKSGFVLFYNSDTMDKNSFRMGLVAGEKGIFHPALKRMDKTRDPYFQSTP